jgi:hypothetical protein
MSNVIEIASIAVVAVLIVWVVARKDIAAMKNRRRDGEDKDADGR